jgi:hypothetical protein
LVLHWDGAVWAEVPVPDRGRDDTLVSVTGSTDSGVWAVGSTCDTAQPARCMPLVLRWSDGRWQVFRAQYDTFVVTEVVAPTSGQVWLIGYITIPVQPQVDHAEFWNGTRFLTDETLLAALPPVSGSGKPASALALAAADVDKVSQTIWAVGWSQGPAVQPHAVVRS